MVHKRVAALFLAHRAVVALDIPSNTIAVPTKAAVADNRLANIIAAAVATDSGSDACSTAIDALNNCIAITSFDSLPEATQAACLCCDSGSGLELDGIYSNCASYIEDNFPRSTDEYSLNSAAATYCAVAGPTCPNGGGLATGTATATSGGDDAVPAACTNAISIASSCADELPGIATMRDSDIASCVCYTDAGTTSTFTTAFDDYASSCAVWAKTADPSDYPAFSALEGFCGDNPPRTTSDGDSRHRSTITRTTDAIPTETENSSTSVEPTTTVTRTTEPTPNVALRGVAGEPVAWVGSVLSFFMSLVFLA